MTGLNGITKHMLNAQNAIRDTIDSYRRKLLGGLEPITA